MDKYNNGKIYQIVTDEEGMCYIGSTVGKSSNRLSQHKLHYKRFLAGNSNYIPCFKLFEKCGIDNCKIELLEYFPCSSKDELHKREREHIRNMNCLNMCVSGRNQKQYMLEHKEEKAEYDKNYRDINKEKRQQQKREYHVKNRSYIIDKVSRWGRQPFACECGVLMRRDSYCKHIKSKKHQNLMNK